MTVSNLKRTPLQLAAGAVVLAAGVTVVVTNPSANAGETRGESPEGRAAVEATALGRSLQRSLGDDYAGSWIDESGKVMVAVTDESRAALVREAGAQPTVVTYSKNELDQVQDVLDGRKAPATVHRWFVDPKTNAVVVEVQRGASDEATTSWVRRAAAESPAVRVVEKARAPQPRVDIVGGLQWSDGDLFCSVGFPAEDSDGGQHFLTAGHCATAEPDGVVTDDDGIRIGEYDSGTDVLGDAGDFAQVNVDDNDDLVGAIDLFNGNLQEIDGSDEVGVGARICRTGAASGPDFGVECGVVTEQDVTVNVDFGDLGTVAVGGQTGTDVCSNGGDSGGPFFSGDQAQGILSSGINFCGDEDVVSHFTPVNTALDALGLTLVTNS